MLDQLTWKGHFCSLVADQIEMVIFIIFINLFSFNLITKVSEKSSQHRWWVRWLIKHKTQNLVMLQGCHWCIYSFIEGLDPFQHLQVWGTLLALALPHSSVSPWMGLCQDLWLSSWMGRWYSWLMEGVSHTQLQVTAYGSWYLLSQCSNFLGPLS